MRQLFFHFFLLLCTNIWSLLFVVDYFLFLQIITFELRNFDLPYWFPSTIFLILIANSFIDFSSTLRIFYWRLAPCYDILVVSILILFIPFLFCISRPFSFSLSSFWGFVPFLLFILYFNLAFSLFYMYLPMFWTTNT